MSWSGPARRRPLLLLLVFGAFLAIVGITATAQAVLVSLEASTDTLNTVVSSDATTVRAVLDQSVPARFLDPAAGPTPAERSSLERQLARLTQPGAIVRVEIRRLDGTIVAASEPGLAGTATPGGPAMTDAVSGRAGIAIVPDVEAGAGGPASLGVATAVREFLPITSAGTTRAVVAIWRDAAPLLQRLEDNRRSVVAITLSAALVTALLLWLIFRAAQTRLSRQTAALIEAERRDPLTGALNHGALVAHLEAAVEAARTTGTPLGVALVDLDNFRLLNDNHGHAAGDEALRAVDEELRMLQETIVSGRYGPDEFLLIAPAASIVALEPALGRLREALASRSLQFAASERLPVTISAAVCTYPDHGSAVTTLLATAARLLEEAKASGGDAIRVAGAADAGEAIASGFDVLQGLVRAVDTKDRYTKRHSEDVARYSVYLAGRLEVEPDLIRAIQTAGLLHDVGKIGIPDAILRKPGALTAAEYDAVKQHVALGDLIVRDVPDLDLVRAGIRHHHERWDGHGYLDRLTGEEIPLIARILAVGDAFSAMTTTRPYRKALELREALHRLEDAAGTQLDEILVRAFVDGIETDANAPLPGDDRAMPSLWIPPRVA